MIHGMMGTIQSDTSVLIQWLKGEEIELQPDEEKEERVQLAAFRMLAAVAMFFGALWALQILTFVVTFPLQALLKLATAIGCFAIAHDVFIMCQNAYKRSMAGQNEKPLCWAIFGGRKCSEEEQALEFTQGTLFQPVYMWAYVNRNKIGTK